MGLCNCRGLDLGLYRYQFILVYKIKCWCAVHSASEYNVCWKSAGGKDSSFCPLGFCLLYYLAYSSEPGMCLACRLGTGNVDVVLPCDRVTETASVDCYSNWSSWKGSPLLWPLFPAANQWNGTDLSTAQLPAWFPCLATQEEIPERWQRWCNCFHFLLPAPFGLVCDARGGKGNDWCGGQLVGKHMISS